MRKGRRRRVSAGRSGGAPSPWSGPEASTAVRSRMSANALSLLSVDLLELHVVDLGRRAVEDQLPFVESDGAVRVLVDQVEEMERAQHGHPVLLVDLLQ